MLKVEIEKIKNIKTQITNMGEQIIETNNKIHDLIKKREFKALKEIKIPIKTINQKSHEIDNMIVTTLALYSPEAKDLRAMVAYLKMTNELVRAAENTKTFLKNFYKNFSDELRTDVILEYTIPMHRSMITALESTLKLLKEDGTNDIKKIYNIIAIEENKTDDLYVMIEKNLLPIASNEHELSKEYFNILSSLRKVEKTADRALSIAMLLMYAKQGGELHQL